jgi:hypothetical protein
VINGSNGHLSGLGGKERTKGLSPVCALLWISRCVFWKKLFLHPGISQSYFLLDFWDVVGVAGARSCATAGKSPWFPGMEPA